MPMQNRTLMKLCPWLANISAPWLRKERKVPRRPPRTLLAAFGTVAALLLVTTPLHADIIEWELTDEFSGGQQPYGTLRVILEDIAEDTVRLTVDATALVGTEFVDGLFLNLDPVLDPTGLTFVPIPAVGEPPYDYNYQVYTGENSFKADGDGRYDILFDFANKPPADRLGAGKDAVFDVEEEDLFASSFLYLSEPEGGHGPFYVAAHVQGIGEDGEGSGWVTKNGNGEVPEASTMVLFGSGLLGVLGFARGKVRSRLGR